VLFSSIKGGSGTNSFFKERYRPMSFDSILNRFSQLKNQAMDLAQEGFENLSASLGNASTENQPAANSSSNQDSYIETNASSKTSGAPLPVIAVSLMAGCGGPPVEDGKALPIDVDGDGWGPGSAPDEDCNDSNAAINPSGIEVCDGQDNDCDGLVDDDDSSVADKSTWYKDDDSDNYGKSDSSVQACVAPSGFVAVDGDCNDDSAANGKRYRPDAPETDCTDPEDYNCDGAVPLYSDADGDGSPGCLDCDDSDTRANPDMTEICDGIDNDCDTEIDEDDGTSVGSMWYLDSDADGYGEINITLESCEKPEGYVSNSDDCNDTDARFNPDAVDSCNNEDNDCDGLIDDAPDLIFYQDSDGDGYGNISQPQAACDAPQGYVANDTDCDDGNTAVFPGAPETCDDQADLNCDGSIGYVDADGDGTAACDDCDDADASINPNATEICNGVDDDCDFDIDDNDDGLDASTQLAFYLDIDSDGYGNPSAAVVACEAPAGAVSNANDCNDSLATINPAATEVCDGGIDNDCDGLSDDVDSDTDSTSKNIWYQDSDGDAYGTASSTTLACEEPAGYTALAGDCDDSSTRYNPAAVESDCTDPNDYNCDGVSGRTDNDADGYAACEECDDTDSSVYPGADEYCNNTDDDCDGTVDEDPAFLGTTYYADGDGDGYGVSADTQVACTQPVGYSSISNDCDDGSASINPAATEICDSSNIDEDCDGITDDADATTSNASKSIWYQDADSDSYGLNSQATRACDQPAGYVSQSGDCNDTISSINPSAQEMCDSSNVDEDCDGFSDDSDSSTTGKTQWYLDADADLFGAANSSLSACDQPTGYVSNATDCNDALSSINPSAQEVCDSSNVDEDCDGVSDDADSSATGQSRWYRDADGDAYGSSSVSQSKCDQPAGYLANSSDCNDTLASVYPGASESCNSIDDDCDGVTDEGVTNTYYADTDSDAYGNAQSPIQACTLPSGYVSNSDDCLDSNNQVNPLATEIYNDALDNNCDNDLYPAVGTLYADAQMGFGSALQIYGLDTASYLGSSCAIGDGTILVGATGVSNGGQTTGAVYVFPGTITSYADTNNATAALFGASNQDDYGYSLASLGDINADGNDDFVVGAPQRLNGQAGFASVLYGPVSNNSNIAKITGESAFDRAGFAVASGESAILISAPYDDDGGNNAGAVYGVSPSALSIGSNSVLNVDLFKIQGATANAQAGYSVTSGDFDADGALEIVLGAPQAGASRNGSVHIVENPSGNISTSTGTTISGSGNNHNLGTSVATSDLDGDGHDDLCMGAIGVGTGGTNAGAVYCVSGSSLTNSAVEQINGVTRIDGGSANLKFGFSLIGSADFDLDGKEDLAAGAPAISTSTVQTYGFLLSGGEMAWGSSYMVPDGAQDRFVSLEGEYPGDYAGYSVAAGDADGDGIPDFLFGAPFLSSGLATNSGAAYLISGNAGGF